MVAARRKYTRSRAFVARYAKTGDAAC
jgi:hypothetical protein